MQTELWAVFSVLLASLLASVAALLLKMGTGELRLSREEIRIGPRIAAAILLYLLSSLFFYLGLLGGPLSLLVPLTATEYIWLVLLARRFLEEQINREKMIGIGCISLGVILVGIGS